MHLICALLSLMLIIALWSCVRIRPLHDAEEHFYSVWGLRIAVTSRQSEPPLLLTFLALAKNRKDPSSTSANVSTR